MSSLIAAASDSAVHHYDGVPSWMSKERTRILTNTNKSSAAKLKSNGKCVVYWMQRDVRTVDNWALAFARYLAEREKIPLQVMYCLPPPPSHDDDGDDGLPGKPMVTTAMPERYGSFLLGGLKLVHNELRKVHVPLHVIMATDQPSNNDNNNNNASVLGAAACAWLDQVQPQIVICDMSPLRMYREWIEVQVVPHLDKTKVPMVQVDAHNVVPVWYASPKREVGARTLRPKIHRVVSKFLQVYPEEAAKCLGNDHIVERKRPPIPDFDMEACQTYLQWDSTVKPIDWAQPGTANAMKQFDSFLRNGLKEFDALRNDPNEGKRILSNLSPWINHGHVSFQTLARQVKDLNRHANGTASYIEEGLVRRELSDNFVFYTPDHYDSLQGAAGWAQESLQVHESDEREWVYSLEEFETAKTHDDLWNAAQMQLVQEGKLHGFLRMYWAKKVLEWTESPTVALRTAQYLNDKFALDGLDPNGFVGVGWSIMGIHDMGWKERPIFGKIRFMNYAGCKRKFKVADFVAKYPGARSNAVAAAKTYGKEPDLATASSKKKRSTESSTTKSSALTGRKKKSPTGGNTTATATKKHKTKR